MYLPRGRGVSVNTPQKAFNSLSLEGEGWGEGETLEKSTTSAFIPLLMIIKRLKPFLLTQRIPLGDR